MDSKHVIGLYEAYRSVYEDQLDEAPYQVYGPDPHGPSDAPSKPLGKPHKDRKSARRKADKLDQEVGGYKHSVSYVPEEVDLYDLVLDHLLDEGYCDDVESAEIIMANMSEEWVDEIVEGFKELSKDKMARVERHVNRTLVPKMISHHDEAEKNADVYIRRKKNPIIWNTIGARGPQSRVKHHISQFKKYKKHTDSAMDALRRSAAHNQASATHKVEKVKSQLRDLGVNPDTPKAKSNIKPFKRKVDEDVYDLVLDYLHDEGYCNDVESAEIIMANMSEEWLDDILEGFKPTHYTQSSYGPFGVSRGKKASQIDRQIQKFKDSGNPVRAQQIDFINRMQDDPEGRKESMETSRKNKTKLADRARRDAERDMRNNR